MGAQVASGFRRRVRAGFHTFHGMTAGKWSHGGYPEDAAGGKAPLRHPKHHLRPNSPNPSSRAERGIAWTNLAWNWFDPAEGVHPT